MNVTYVVSQDVLDSLYAKYLSRVKGVRALHSLHRNYELCSGLVARGEMTEDPDHLMAGEWDFSGAVVRFFPLAPAEEYSEEDLREYWEDYWRDDPCSGGICGCCGRTRGN